MDIWETIVHQHRQGVRCVVVTVAGVRGSVPGEPGSKAVITEEGLLAGTLGGGRVEARAIEFALRMLATGGTTCERHCWNLQRDVGMTCGGEMELLFETVLPRAEWHIVIFGAGHVAQAVAGVLASLACRVDVIDPRSDWLNRLPSRTNVTCHHVDDYPSGLAVVDGKSYVLCLTKGHTSDRPVLREVLRNFPEIPFLGVIGSASKRAVLLRELREDGIRESLLERIICPVGLPIGSNDPAEIAISIVAQLLEKRGR